MSVIDLLLISSRFRKFHGQTGSYCLREEQMAPRLFVGEVETAAAEQNISRVIEKCEDVLVGESTLNELYEGWGIY